MRNAAIGMGALTLLWGGLFAAWRLIPLVYNSWVGWGIGLAVLGAAGIAVTIRGFSRY